MRRGIVAIVLVALVGASTFGLGYLLGRRARPGSSGTPSVSPTTVLVPKVLHLALTVAVQQILDARLAVGKVEIRTGGEPGTIVAQFPPEGTSTQAGSPVDLFVSTSRHPRGAFEQCPALAGTLPPGPDAVHEAEQAAVRFAGAFLLGDWKAVRDLLDPSTLPLRTSQWTIAGKPDRVKVLGSATSGGMLVGYGCGRRVAKKTVTVVIEDGTTSASADFNLYLVHRPDGWKVWASY
jgi:hypothetical protein